LSLLVVVRVALQLLLVTTQLAVALAVFFILHL
jgi:hypothetical protein